MPDRLFDLPPHDLPAPDAPPNAPFTSADVLLAAAGIVPVAEDLVHLLLLTNEEVVALCHLQTQPPDLTGHICEHCFDAMATVWVPATDQEDEHGRCAACDARQKHLDTRS